MADVRDHFFEFLLEIGIGLFFEGVCFGEFVMVAHEFLVLCLSL